MKDCSAARMARGLCNKHYYRFKAAGTLDEVTPNPSGPCEQCGEQIPRGRRWGARFCCPECKQSSYDAAARAGNARVRAARVKSCSWCRGSLGDKRMDARFCSDQCADSWGNHQKALMARRAKQAARKPCELCGKPIPEGRRADAVYCSTRCKQLSQRSLSPRSRRTAQDYNLNYLYGITREEFDAALAAQGGGCAICGTTEWSGRHNRPCADHCHATRRFRGILCSNCNQGVGMFGDAPARLRAAAAYLEAAMIVGEVTL